MNTWKWLHMMLVLLLSTSYGLGIWTALYILIYLNLTTG